MIVSPFFYIVRRMPNYISKSDEVVLASSDFDYFRMKKWIK